MASIHEILESMRPDFQAVNALLSKAMEGITELIAINKEFRANLDDLRLIVSEMGHEESETKNGDIEEELQSCFEGDVKVESDDSTGNRECSEKVLILKNHSVSNSHHSPFSHHPSDRKFDSRNTWVQRRKFKNDQLCVCQRKPHVICHFRTWDDGTIKIWHPGDSAIFIRYAWICKAALTGIWDPGGIFLENLTASWEEKARKCGEATSTPTVRSIDKESEPLVGMGNTKGNDGPKPWCNSKRQIQDSCSSKAVKYSRFEVADMGSRTKNDATAKYIQTLTHHQFGCIFSDSHQEKDAFFQAVVVVTCMIKGFAGCFCKFWWLRRLSNSLMLGIFLKFRTHMGSIPAVFCFRILLFLQVLDTQYMDDVRHGCYEWGLIYVFGELGLLDCSREMFGEMSGPYLATEITILNATAESLVLLLDVYVHIFSEVSIDSEFLLHNTPDYCQRQMPNQSIMQFLAGQHFLLRAAFEQFNLVFFVAHYTHISIKEASMVAAPRKKIVEKINVVKVGVLIDNLMLVEAKDKIEIVEFQLQLLEFEEVIVAMLGEVMNVNHCFENKSEPNMHSVGRILEQQIGISSLGHSSNISFFLVQSFKSIASKPSMLNLVTDKNNGVKMDEGPLAEDHKILRGRVIWAAKVSSCLYISFFYKFWDPGGFDFGKVSFQGDSNLRTCYSKAVYLLLQALLIFILERTYWVSWIVRAMCSITLLINIGNTKTRWTSAWVIRMNPIRALLNFFLFHFATTD